MDWYQLSQNFKNCIVSPILCAKKNHHEHQNLLPGCSPSSPNRWRRSPALAILVLSCPTWLSAATWTSSSLLTTLFIDSVDFSKWELSIWLKTKYKYKFPTDPCHIPGQLALQQGATGPLQHLHGPWQVGREGHQGFGGYQDWRSTFSGSASTFRFRLVLLQTCLIKTLLQYNFHWIIMQL